MDEEQENIEHFNKITNVHRNLPSRGYNLAVGRFLKVDPIAKDFPWVTPYNYAENKVPNASDLHGLQSYIHRVDKHADGTIKKKTYLDKNLEYKDGVYVVNRYIQDGSVVGGNWRVASYEEFPNMFPHGGNYKSVTQRPFLTFDGHIQGLFGEVAGTIPTSFGNVGIAAGVEGNLGKFSYNYNEGFNFTSIFSGDNSANVGAELSFLLSPKKRYEFNTKTGQPTGNSTSGIGIKYGLFGIEYKDNALKIGPDVKYSLGFGIDFDLKLSINFQSDYTSQEKSLINSLKSKSNVTKKEPDF